MPVVQITQSLHFEPAGGKLSVRMESNASPGHYSLMLLEHDRFTIAKDFGNVKFDTIAANTHVLPDAATAQDGRILHAVTSVGIVDPAGTYAVFMTLMQDGREIGSVTDHGTSTALTAESDLVGVMSAAPALMAFNASAAALIRPHGDDAKRLHTTLTERKATLRADTRELVAAPAKPRGRGARRRSRPEDGE
jgi:hypothetical protein